MVQKHLGILHGARNILMTDKDGQIAESHSEAAGLDYPGHRTITCFIKDTKELVYIPQIKMLEKLLKYVLKTGKFKRK